LEIVNNLFFRYYDGDQDSLFNEAHVVSPYKKDPRQKVSFNLLYSTLFNILLLFTNAYDMPKQFYI